MKISQEKPHSKQIPGLADGENALRSCQAASELIHVGKYEEARAALGEWWCGLGQRPALEGLGPPATAEVLLQCGVLSGWLGSVRQVSGAQEMAKDLLTEAERGFEALGLGPKVSEVKYELAECYFRLGAYDEARVVLDDALLRLGEGNEALKAKIAIRRASIEIWSGRYHEAWSVLGDAEPFFENCNDAIKGKWHGQRALVLRRLSASAVREDYADRAIIEYVAAIHHYELANHERYCATNLNNLAFLLYKLGRFADAHENLDRAVKVLTRLNDDGLLAQVNETRARVLLAEKRYKEAGRVIAGVVRTLEAGGESALIASAMTAEGAVNARMGFYDKSERGLRSAVELAREAGALTEAGLAALVLLEEHGEERLSEAELKEYYLLADQFLRNSEDAEERERLRVCARRVIRRLGRLREGPEEMRGSLPEAVAAYEAKLIEQALKAEQGVVTRTAQRLGIRYQTLSELLKARHKDLMRFRTPVKPRKKRSEATRKPRGG